ncbi:uncharacterized protein EI90DRAFT_2482789 [Cantharellus anzutake]|uniref:uncharacterized protein n=1 Tax=Cantharellus anzutake TaxID=1750568 RepID=UPI001908484F|nr:uncharacterized protein EI90DRAFT_2482789 [Cantharellus anzutake]KAF8322357.1 hypothetical protein EI90DRAFT_2482789 [Cantharellus anzutake]
MTDAAQESLVALPSPVLARGVSLPHPLSPPTSSDARTAVTNMDSQPSGIAETPLPDPKIFFHEDNHTSYDIWVHPNLPNRTFVVESIKAHGGQIVEHVAEAFFAIIHTDMTPGDYPELCNDEQGTVGISSEWVLNSVRAQCVQDPEDYVLWKPEEEEEQNEQSDGGQEAKNWDWEDVDVEAPALEDLLSLPSRPEISNLPPSPATKSLDEKFFLWIVPRFFAPRPAAPWIDLYRWLGAHIPHRSENYWTNLNHKGSEVRRRANALLPLIPPRPGSTTRGAKRKSNPPKSGHADESSKATRRYADSENEAMIRHIASHPQLDGKALWSAFSGKHCERSSQAYNQHHDRHREYFNAAVTRFLRGENPPFQPPEASSCQASDIDPPETVVTRHGRRPKYTPEEHRAMKEFYAKHRHKYSKDFHVWLAFEKLVRDASYIAPSSTET